MKKYIIGIVIVALILLASYAIQQATKPVIKEPEYFTPQPETWIEDNEKTAETGDIAINVYKATDGKAVADTLQEDYNLNGDIISFFYRGGYNGIPFKTYYFADEFYTESEGKTAEQQEALAKKYLLMKISPEMNPSDSVIDGFILGKIENNRFIFYVFVDEDWKQKLEYTNIVWGDDFTNPATLHVKPFEFQKATNGIYVTKVAEDVDWFEQKPISGGMAVGEINKGVIQKLINGEDINATFMYVR